MLLVWFVLLMVVCLFCVLFAALVFWRWVFVFGVLIVLFVVDLFE